VFRLGVLSNFAPHTMAIVFRDIYFVKRLSKSFCEYPLKFADESVTPDWAQGLRPYILIYISKGATTPNLSSNTDLKTN
jgi:hypothetical protein